MKDGTARLTEIDIIKGFALLGILLVNIDFMSHSALEYDRTLAYTNSFDFAWGKIKFLTLAQRFIGIFSLFFGLSLALQQQQVRSKGLSFKKYFFKRNAVLALLGILHLLFFFRGDILIIYSLLSLILYLLMRFSDKVLLTVAAFIFIVPSLVDTMDWFRHATTGFRNSIDEYYSSESIIEAYRSGSIPDIMTMRLVEYFHYDLTGISWNRTALAMIITGYVAGRNNWHLLYLNYLPQLKNIFRVSVILYLILFIYFFRVDFEANPSMLLLYHFHILISIGIYILGFLFLYRNKTIKHYLQVLAPVGKMSLTNYILQSVICSFIFTGYGFSLFGTTTPTQDVLICAAVYCSQIFFSNYYLRGFKTGPLEIMWHKLVY